MTIPAHLATSFTDGPTQKIYAAYLNDNYAKVNTLIDHVEDSVMPLGVEAITASTYTTAVDLTGKSHVTVALDANIGSLEFTWPTVAVIDIAITQDATGGRTISIADVTWEGGDDPIIDTTANATTTVTLVTTDGGTTIRGYHGQARYEAEWSSASGTNLATATNIPVKLVVQPIRILYVAAYAVTAPTGASIIVDVNWNGTTIYSTQANRPTIAAGSNASSTTLPNTVALTPSGGNPGRLSIDIDQVGSTTAGQGLTVLVQYLALN